MPALGLPFCSIIARPGTRLYLQSNGARKKLQENPLLWNWIGIVRGRLMKTVIPLRSK